MQALLDYPINIGCFCSIVKFFLQPKLSECLRAIEQYQNFTIAFHLSFKLKKGRVNPSFSFT